jgi:dipeptidyl aminopeptidase/acylaminoacyl peptidase
MSMLRRAAVAATAVCAVTSTVLVGGGLATAAPAVVNGDLAFSEFASVVTQAPQESGYHFAAEGSNAKYSPDGRRIAYTSASGSVGYGIFVKTLGTSTQRQLGTQPVSGLAWSPDGTSLVVASGNQLLRVTVSTGAAAPIYTGGVPLRDPAWSPDGTRIAFTTGPKIQLVRPDGTGLRAFTSGGSANNHPDWSPDGTKIAFITDRYVPAGGDTRAEAELVTLPRSGLGEPVRVSHRAFPKGLYYMGVAWSPDGRKIAALQFNATHLPNEEDTDERFKVRGYLPDGSSSYSMTGPIYGDDGPEGLDWAPKVS